jgi:hypothetical protein
MYYLSDVRYGGAPDECNHHWPIQLVDGYCPVKDCVESREQQQVRPCNYHWPTRLVDGYCPVKGCPDSDQRKEQ